MRPLFALIFSLLLAAPAAAREAYALLIGASTYPNIDESFWLRGPANDVTLVRQFLLETQAIDFAPGNIVTLADGVDGAEAPTLAAIRREMAALARRVAPGDFVYLHFSGHGSQSPAADPTTELDGLDETFMPVDIGPWNDEIGTVPNALTDDEIGQMLDNLRAAGADVWAVFDSCHSATATRGQPNADEAVKSRQLPRDALGIPDDRVTGRAAPDPRAPPEAPIDLPQGAGRLTAFFAAQSNETTIEKNLPRGQPDRTPQGVFTWAIFETLAEHPGLTYRELGQEILRKYSVERLASATPMFEGTLDVPVFGNADAARAGQWPATVRGESLTVDAGDLHGIGPGAEFLILASPADADEQALGVARAVKTTTFRTEARPQGLAAADLPKGVWLRRTGETVDFSLTVSLPAPGPGAAARVAEAARLIAEDGLAGPRLRFVGPDEEADLRLAILPGSDAVWLLPGSGVVTEADLATLPRRATDGAAFALADVLAEDFLKIATATNLMRIGGLTPPGNTGVTAELMRARFDPLDAAVDSASRSPVATAVPRMVPDDVIGLRLDNTSDVAVDYNILYIGADWSISFIDNGRLLPGARLDDDFVLISDSAFGRDRMLVILTPAAPQGEVEDLSFLEQSPVDRARAAGAPAVREGFAALLDEAGFGAATRSAVSLKSRRKTAGPQPEILQFEIDTRPAG